MCHVKQVGARWAARRVVTEESIDDPKIVPPWGWANSDVFHERCDTQTEEIRLSLQRCPFLPSLGMGKETSIFSYKVGPRRYVEGAESFLV